MIQYMLGRERNKRQYVSLNRKMIIMFEQSNVLGFSISYLIAIALKGLWCSKYSKMTTLNRLLTSLYH